MRKRGKFLNIILIAVVVLVVLFVIASIVIINHYMKQYFNRSEQKKYSEYMRWADFEDFIFSR